MTPRRLVAAAALAAAWLVGGAASAHGQGVAAPARRLPNDLAPALDAADLAFLSGDDATAQSEYGRILERERGFRPAQWGRAAALLRLGRDYEAWPLLDEALGPEPSAEACLGAARLATSPPPDGRTLGMRREAAARGYLERAGRGFAGAPAGGKAPEEVETEVRLARSTGREADALRAWQSLVATRPERYAYVERPGRAGRVAVPARRPGPVDPTPALGGNWEHVWYVLGAALAVGVLWALGLGALVVAGDALSRMTARLADRHGRGLAIPPAHGAARLAYRAAIVATAVFFDVSLAVLGLLILVVPGSVLYVLATSPAVPGWAVAAAVPLGLVPALMVAPLVRSLWANVGEAPQGREVRDWEAPGLWALAREVAAKVGTRPVDEIRLSTGTILGVKESAPRRGVSTRTLLLGLANLDAYAPAAFRAVLAHEYAHLMNRDTAQPAAAARLGRRLERTHAWIALWRGDAWWNLGWHFVSAYARIFRHLMLGASRFAEVHADRAAALTYGPGAAAAGLLTVVRHTFEFEYEQSFAAKEALLGGLPTPYLPLRNRRAVRCRWIAEHVAAQLAAAPQDDHTHPTLARRLARFRSLAAELTDRDPADDAWLADPASLDPDPDAMWGLFADPDFARAEYRRALAADVQARFDACAAVAWQTLAPLTDAVRSTPDRPDPYLDRAEVLCRLGDLRAALADLDEAVALNGHYSRGRYARGQLRRMLGDHAGAEVDLREALRLSRGLFETGVREALGDLAAAAGDFALAETEYTRHLEFADGDPLVRLRRANARLALGKASKAADDFARIAEDDLRSAEAHLGLAEAREAEGDLRAALAAAEKAVAIDPYLPDAHLAVARLLLDLGEDLPRAAAHARKAITRARDVFPEAEALLVRALEQSEAAVGGGE